MTSNTEKYFLRSRSLGSKQDPKEIVLEDVKGTYREPYLKFMMDHRNKISTIFFGAFNLLMFEELYHDASSNEYPRLNDDDRTSIEKSLLDIVRVDDMYGDQNYAIDVCTYSNTEPDLRIRR